jgi:phosphopantetheinyl transferase (holo-ACP synthase)
MFLAAFTSACPVHEHEVQTYQRRNELFDRVTADPELAGIESARAVGRALIRRFPGEWASDEAAYKAFTRARKAAGGDFIGGRWLIPD